MDRVIKGDWTPEPANLPIGLHAQLDGRGIAEGLATRSEAERWWKELTAQVAAVNRLAGGLFAMGQASHMDLDDKVCVLYEDAFLAKQAEKYVKLFEDLLPDMKNVRIGRPR